MTNDTAPFLICARQETRNVNKVNDWNIESITETDEREDLSDALMSKQPAITFGWLAMIPTD